MERAKSLSDSIVIAKAFSHMLNLANLAEEVQIAYRRRNKLDEVRQGELDADKDNDVKPELRYHKSNSLAWLAYFIAWRSQLAGSYL